MDEAVSETPLEATRVVEEAFGLIVTSGPSEFSSEQIAMHLGCEQTTLAGLFPTTVDLYRAMVEANTQVVLDALTAANPEGQSALERLERVGGILMSMSVNDRSVALYRVAGADDSGALGRAIVDFGRVQVLPYFEALMCDAIAEGDLVGLPLPMVETFLSLLIGDRQLRRITGAIPMPDEWTCAARAAKAVSKIKRLYPVLQEPAETDQT